MVTLYREASSAEVIVELIPKTNANASLSGCVYFFSAGDKNP